MSFLNTRTLNIQVQVRIVARSGLYQAQPTTNQHPHSATSNNIYSRSHNDQVWVFAKFCLQFQQIYMKFCVSWLFVIRFFILIAKSIRKLFTIVLSVIESLLAKVVVCIWFILNEILRCLANLLFCFI